MSQHVFSLLSERQALLLEPADAPHGVRYKVVVARSVPGKALVLQLSRAGEADQWLDAGAVVGLHVPVSTHLWRFETTVLRQVPGDQPLLAVAWPENAVQVRGRRFPRAEVVIPIGVQPADESGPRIFGYSLDLSVGGAKLYHSAELAPDAALNLRLLLGNVKVDVPGRVAWQRPVPGFAQDPHVEMGIAFEEVSALLQKRLSDLVLNARVQRRHDEIN